MISGGHLAQNTTGGLQLVIIRFWEAHSPGYVSLCFSVAVLLLQDMTSVGQGDMVHRTSVP